MKKKFFMCDPNHFDVVYELSTNAHMNINVRPNKKLAHIQWRNLFLKADRLADIVVAKPSEGLPDQVFFANAGLPYKNTLILSKFYHEERERETTPNHRFFYRHFHHEAQIVEPAACFEGQGDAIWLDENTLLIGYGIRTNSNGIRWVEEVLTATYPQVRVVAVEMKQQFEFYHLDTCCFWMPKQKVFMVYTGAFTGNGLATLSKFGQVRGVRKDEAMQFVCNSVVMDDDTVFSPWANDRTRDIIREGGYPNTEAFPMSEFMKAGGAVKCLMLEHNYPV